MNYALALILTSIQATANATGSELEKSVQLKNIVEASLKDTSNRFNLGQDKNSIEFLSAEGETLIKRCQLKESITQAKLSFDQSAVIVSANGYIPTERLLECDQSPLVISKVSAIAGMLVDINVKKRVFVSLSVVSTQPMSYLATVSRIGATKSVISLPGAYVARDSALKQRRQAFVYSDDGGPAAKISLNGRYVAANGSIDCAADAYPGVWDIQRNRKVIIIEELAPRNKKCEALFTE
jgi:hypothetical protein